MHGSIKTDVPPEKKVPARLFGWFNKRTGINSLMRASLDEPIPGGARLAYIFGSGLLFIFISQVITGLCLALNYVPSAESAHTSVAYITKQVAAGQFLRSLHYYGSSAMIIVLVLHFLQTFIYGSFKGRRELLWMSGAFLSLLVLGMGFTGYLLPWDQSAYFATAVGTNLVGEVPVIGQWLTDMLRGGTTLGTLTLSRFYFAHVFLIPAMIFLFIGVHIALFRKAGPAGPIEEDPIDPKLPPESFYPRQVIIDMAFALLLMIGLGFLAYFHPIQLGPVADPANTRFVPRPEWYYLPMFEWLKFWPSRLEVFAVVVIPGILALVFFLVPFLDRSLERRPWRRPIPLLAVTIVLVGIIFLGFRSHLDDMRDSSVAAQLAFQDKQAEDYTRAPFHARLESATGAPLSSGPVDPLVASGKVIFDSKGCSGCHGDAGTGTAVAPSLVAITSKYPAPQFSQLLQHPNAKMVAGHMPVFDLPATDMAALFSYLGSLGRNGAGEPAASAGVEPIAAAAAVAPSTSSATAAESGKAPANSADGANPAAASAGETIFQGHGCAGCHGEAGAGTARVPAMAGLIAKHSDAQLAKLLQSPDSKMQAGGMPPLQAPAKEISDVVAYLRTLAPAAAVQPVQAATGAAAPAQSQPSAAQTSATKPETTPGPTAAPAMTASSEPAKPQAADAGTPTSPGRAIFVANGCAACHGVNAQGTHFAPSLIGITKLYPPAQLADLLHHPKKEMRDGGMPAVKVNDAQMNELVSYLSGLGTAAAPSAAGSHGTQSAAPPPAAGAGNVAAAVTAVKPVPLSADAVRGRMIFQSHSCETCHGIGGLKGTIAAPGLAGTASILPPSTLENLLRHHSVRMQKGGMPLTNMSDRDTTALVAYIRSMPAEGGDQ
jgi:ubiquinol-cytochrome c reductase cytochrome b subunit